MNYLSKDKQIIVTFRTSNGNMWEETHYSSMLDLLRKDPTVYEIRNKSDDVLVYKKLNN